MADSANDPFSDCSGSMAVRFVRMEHMYVCSLYDTQNRFCIERFAIRPIRLVLGFYIYLDRSVRIVVNIERSEV